MPLITSPSTSTKSGTLRRESTSFTSTEDLLGKPSFRTVVESKGSLDVTELELQIGSADSRYVRSDHHARNFSLNNHDDEERSSRKNQPCFYTCLPLGLVVLVVIIVLLPILDHRKNVLKDGQKIDLFPSHLQECGSTCKIVLVESIPDGLIFGNSSFANPSIYSSWKDLILNAQVSIEIASYYWTMKGEDVIDVPSDWQGEEIFQLLKDAGLQRQIAIRIAQNKPSSTSMQNNTQELQDLGAAEVRTLDFDRLVGAGILHTKFWVVDNKHLFIGSANMDWRSLTQVKELGATVTDCPCLAQDLGKVFEVYWSLGLPDSVVPSVWPDSLSTTYNKDTPLAVSLNDTPVSAYIASSPPSFSPKGRTGDIDAILDTIGKARQFVYIAVMDYIPAYLYTSKPQFWPVIDDALRTIAIGQSVEVRLLMSHWPHSRSNMILFLRSLQDINQVYSHVKVQVKLFVVPSFTPEQESIPFARVNHNKYMVTDNTAYIGTSNWSADYFLNTGGVSLLVNDTMDAIRNKTFFRQQLQNVFERDWNSEYAFDLDAIYPCKTTF